MLLFCFQFNCLNNYLFVTLHNTSIFDLTWLTWLFLLKLCYIKKKMMIMVVFIIIIK